jgi:hypothetical protein
MGGKNAKRRAKAAKAGVRSLEMHRDLWRMLADVSSTADTIGATPTVVDGCRVLAARAKYYLGEPENKRGLVRGELTSKEWNAYLDLVGELGNASPKVKALADAMEELDNDGGLAIRGIVDVKEQDEEAQRDAAMIFRPDSLERILSTIGAADMISSQTFAQIPMPEEQKSELEAMTGVPVEQFAKATKAVIASAKAKLAKMRDSLLMSKGNTRVAFTLDLMEAAALYSLLADFQENVKVKVKGPPEIEQAQKDHAELIECAIRFFGRMAGDEVTK